MATRLQGTTGVVGSRKLAYGMLMTIFVFFVVADTIITWIWLSHVGIHGEGNPIAKAIISEHGWMYIMGLKGMGFAGLASFALYSHRKQKYTLAMNLFLIGVTLLVVAVFAYNMQMFAKVVGL